ncbi:MULTISPECIES: plasmid mobilization protein [Streptomyces]|uniref:Plasmid mobilization relaxosome protein MobC n=1 Tax=Streptomyces evansiae TaxID=3075535 RepID=A0ABU2QY69_9ACTN|nr:MULTISPECIES: plasmid mobilization relaxosome protein MobC [unclassified Streptomyces]MDT0409393.1 plasmid mobilization relaxosome protein MobC [Streptomyces sp. DSM 41979]MYQ59733.1 plasmid mobilization relaxosome protein MobC [Streptomyces sp. SID4926]
MGAKASDARGASEAVGPGAPTGEGPAHRTPDVPQQCAPRRRLRNPKLRDRRVSPRFNDAEFVLVRKAAALSRMTPGGYVAESALAAARADDPTAAVADYRAMVQALMTANGQLGKVGSNLNQLARHMNMEGEWPLADTVMRLLARVEASIADVDTAVARTLEAR